MPNTFIKRVKQLATNTSGVLSKYKKQCDTYFWNAHRNEARGIGGLFFDYCKANGHPSDSEQAKQMSMEDWFNFVTEVGDSFLEAYVPIVEKEKIRSILLKTEIGRKSVVAVMSNYIWFTTRHFIGLKTNGRIESILMSLPPHVQWVYNHHAEAGSDEEKLVMC